MRAKLTPNVNAWDGELISYWPLRWAFHASLKRLGAQLFRGLKRYFATWSYPLPALGLNSVSEHLKVWCQWPWQGSAIPLLCRSCCMHWTCCCALHGRCTTLTAPDGCRGWFWLALLTLGSAQPGTARSCLNPPSCLLRSPTALPWDKMSTTAARKDSSADVSSKIKHGLSVQD